VSAGLESLSLAARLGNALVAYLGYLGQSFWPRGLGLGYPHAGSAPPAGRILLSVLILGLVSAAALRWRVRHPCLLVGWCWFLGVLVPTIGLVQVGVVARADRYLYLPLVGLSLATAWLAGSWALASRSRRLAVGAAGAAIVVALWSLTPRQVRYWADDVALFTRGVDAIADNVVARNGLGVALARRGDLVGAEAQFREALRIRPDLVLGVQNLALILSQTGRTEEAAALVERALETWARPGTLALPELTFTLARIRAGQGRAADAEALYARAAGLDRRHWAAFYNWGNLLAARGRFDEAAARYAEARSLNPDDPAIVNNLGLALLLQGRPGEAIGGLTEGVRQHPGSGLLRTSLGRALVAAGRREEGLAQLREGVHLAAGNPEAHLQLAQALADQGRTTEAAVHFREAARLDPAASPAPATRR
jgi:Flp pilus assembly protein TadD